VESIERATIPNLRNDLSLYPVTPDTDGEPTWLLFDPFANKHFQLGETQVELLGLLDSMSVDDVVSRAAQLLNKSIDSQDVEDLINFLRVNNLVVADAPQIRWFKRQLELADTVGTLEKIVRNPIFFRIPLWNPDSFLEKTLPYIRWLGSTLVLRLTLIFGFIGLILIAQRPEVFVTTFLHFFTLKGLSLYLITLFFVKICHELGHAYVAKSLGCRVPVIGVAFIVGWPILYTDTTDAWKVSSRIKKMRIGFAGIRVEIAIACISLLLWNFLDDSPVRSIVFLLSTTTWVLSVLINLNPLMRFDGYYLLSDWLRVPNLEQRSFETARWYLREKIFRINHAPPETFQLKLFVFALGVWVYRFFLFLGIALLVYHFLFKSLGIIFFVLALYYFIARPIRREFTIWWKFRGEITWNPATVRSCLIIAIAIAVILIPWRSSLSAPSYLTAEHVPIYIAGPARLSKLINERSGPFDKGEVIAILESPELDKEIQSSELKITNLTRQSMTTVFDVTMLANTRVLDSELRTEIQKLISLRDQRERLTIEAPLAGKVVDLAEGLSIGSWLPDGTQIATVVNPSEVHIVSYIEEENLFRVKEGMTAYFFSEGDEFSPFELEVSSISSTATRELDDLYLASLFGGDIAVRETQDGKLSTVHSIYQVNLTVIDPVTINRVVRGTTIIVADTQSMIARLYKFLMKTLIREASV
jgi:putative peptide zinc metalloprotease protein